MRPNYFYAFVAVLVLLVAPLWYITLSRAPLKLTASAQGACYTTKGNIHLTMSTGCHLKSYAISYQGSLPTKYTLAGGTFDIIDLALIPGDYTIFVEDDCGRKTSQSVRIDDNQFALDYNVIHPTSFTSNDGKIEIIPNHAGVYECSWNFNPALKLTTAKNLGPGFYTVTVTNSQGCAQALSSMIKLVPEYSTDECLPWASRNLIVKPMNDGYGGWLYNCMPGMPGMSCTPPANVKIIFAGWMTAYLSKNSSGLIIGDCGNTIRFTNSSTLYHYLVEYGKTISGLLTAPPASKLPVGSVTDPAPPAAAEINKLAAELIALEMNLFQVDERSSMKPKPLLVNTLYLAEPFKYQILKDIYPKINHALGCGELNGTPVTPAQYEEMYQALKKINDNAYYVTCYK